MKQLVFVRHSIAQNAEDVENDFDRNLTNEGLLRIKNVISKIPMELTTQASFYSSPAKRCIQTAKYFADLLTLKDITIHEDSFLYSCFREHSFYYFLEEIASNEQNVWIFGHNPMLSNLTEQLLNKNFYSLPKCAVVIFKSTAKQWIEVNHENTEMLLFINPKTLPKYEDNT